jgi:pimeloyl-ACP methyl ester carboxylesterase
VIWGRDDPVIPLAIGKRIERSIPGARLVVFDSGHSPRRPIRPAWRLS